MEGFFAEWIFLDDVKCTGYESNLGECKHREWMQSNCNAGEAAGVVCAGSAAPSAVDIARPQPADNDLKIHAQTGQAITSTTAPVVSHHCTLYASHKQTLYGEKYGVIFLISKHVCLKASQAINTKKCSIVLIWCKT